MDEPRLNGAGFFSPDMQTLLLAAFVAFGGAMLWLGVVSSRLTRLNKDMDQLQKEVNRLNILLRADLLARRMLEIINRQDPDEQ